MIRPLHLAHPPDAAAELLRLGLEADEAGRLAGALSTLALRITGLVPGTDKALSALGLPVRLITSDDGRCAILAGFPADLRAIATARVPALAELSAEVAAVLGRIDASAGPVRFGTHVLRLDQRVHIMGILNVTPDSFADGGRYFRLGDALRHAERLLAEGADILDVGGESSRPAGPYGQGAAPVTEDEEVRRTAPVIRAVVERFACPVSVDTVKATVARAALEAGACLVNDISAIRSDPGMAGLVAQTGAGIVLMHMKGTPATMQKSPDYEDLTGEVYGFLEERVAAARNAGIADDRIVVDPGIGFGKRYAHNNELLRRLPELRGLGCPVLVGASRKAFLGAGRDMPPADRLEGTLAAHALSVAGGARLLRVHDVQAAARAVRAAEGILSSQPVSGPGPAS